MKKIIIMFLLFLLIPLGLAQIPTINSYVTDKAGIISLEAKNSLEVKLRDLEKSTNGVQFIVYIENEYQKAYSLEEYTLKIAEQNKIGKTNNDNGILLYVAVHDREFRWEVGYGAESTLNSALLGRVSREYLIPNFKDGNYEKGVLESVDVALRILQNSNDADILKLKQSATANSNPKAIILIFFLAIIFLSTLSSIFSSYLNRKFAQKSGTKRSFNDRTYKNAANAIFWASLGSSFGKGRGGGGFGGFSGGGGNFGGGGFSSRW